jgi:septum formation protein
MRLILASASPRRQELLKQAGFNFLSIPSRYREAHSSLNPVLLTKKFALAKAREVRNRVFKKKSKQVWILGADTVVALGNRVFPKPENYAQAEATLKLLSGKSHRVLTSLALVSGDGNLEYSVTEITKVFFRKLTSPEIQKYLLTGQFVDKAGAYGIQGAAAVFVKKIEGCYFNVVGLPLARLAELIGEIK